LALETRLLDSRGARPSDQGAIWRILLPLLKKSLGIKPGVRRKIFRRGEAAGAFDDEGGGSLKAALLCLFIKK